MTDKQLNDLLNVFNKMIAAIQGKSHTFENYTDATRPAAAAVSVGFTFFNTSDNFLNTSDGTDWRDPAGNIT